jgi:hypothetical protein
MCEKRIGSLVLGGSPLLEYFLEHYLVEEPDDGFLHTGPLAGKGRIGRGCYHPPPFQEPYMRLSAHTVRAFRYPVKGGRAKKGDVDLV